MKQKLRTTLTLIALALLTGLALAQDFRGSTWGDSMDHVRKTETFLETNTHPNGKHNTLRFHGTIPTMNVNVLYTFAEGALVSAMYEYTQWYADPNLYLVDYQNVLNALENKYGNADFNNAVWHNDLHKTSPLHHGLSVAAGNLALYAQWTTDRTLINHSAAGQNGQITMATIYRSAEHFEGLNSERVQKLENAF